MHEILDLNGDNRFIAKRIYQLLDRLPLAEQFESANDLNDAFELERIRINNSSASLSPDKELRFRAIAAVLIDLAKIGWSLRITKGAILGASPDFSGIESKGARQLALIAQRNEQLREPAVQRFITDLERPRFHNGRRVSIFSLMRDGRELADVIERAGGQLDAVVNPYLQAVDADKICDHTGLRLMDIWRYFRHGWSNPYNSIPGRSMMVLVRDASAEFHPIIGILALSSASVRLAARDRYLGWESDAVVDRLRSEPSISSGRWLRTSAAGLIEDVFIQDLIEDGLASATMEKNLNIDTIAALREEAERCRKTHLENAHSDDHKQASSHVNFDDSFWERQARTSLFRKKRCEELAALLEAQIEISSSMDAKNTKTGLTDLVDSAAGRRAVSAVVKRLKSRQVGTSIADITVCGAIPPYNHLLGGKLVAMLAVSPQMVDLYRKRYAEMPSVIASSMSGRRVVRPSDLVFITTTSLYGIRPCQYDRVAVPLERLGRPPGDSIRFKFLKKTTGFGTFQFTSATSGALSKFLRASKNGSRVNYVFGEGASPRLRNIRDGLVVLGFDEQRLLHHGQSKCIYGISLVENLREFLLGIHKKPKYKFNPRRIASSCSDISAWWIERWLQKRRTRDDWPQTIARLEAESLALPVRHGARIELPNADLEQGDMFEL